MNKIITALRAVPRRDIYESGGWPRGEYWITYQGGGPFPKAEVMSLLELGILKQKYPDCECYELTKKGESK